MALADLLSELYADLGHTSVPAPVVTQRFTRYLNDGLRVVMGEPGMQRLLESDGPLSVASVASQARYTLPEVVAQIRAVSERTNDRTLSAMVLGQYRRVEPNPTTVTGTPTHYVPIGPVAVAVQPSDSSTIFVKSTSASDTQVAFIEGVTSAGVSVRESVTLTGVTAVSWATALVSITDVYLSAVAVGTVTVHEDSGTGTELARILATRSRPRYSAFYLWPTPAAVVTYLVDYRRELVPLLNEADEPPLPRDFHWLITAYARMREYEKTGDSRLTVASEHFTRGLSRLKYAIGTGADEIPVMGGRIAGHSRLGGYYPADTWTRV